MENPVKQRLDCYDWIRVFSCFCVLTVHFNAAVSGFNGNFQYPNSILPNYFGGGRIYLGDIGVSLFFMLSGATLMHTYKDVKMFYVKRIKSIFPLFWITYLLVSVYDFFEYKTIGGGNIALVLYSILGLDGYLCTLGMIPYDFYKIGEWFLGCILLIYTIFPLLHWGMNKNASLTVCLALLVYGLFIGRLHTISFILRIPEILLGMLFSKYCLYKKPVQSLLLGTIVFVIGWTFRGYIQPLTLCISVCILLAFVLTALSQTLRLNGQLLALLSNLTYPAFLIHHWLISKMIKGFPLQDMGRRDVIAMFAIYLALTFVLSRVLFIISGRVMNGIAKMRSQPLIRLK